MLIYPINTYTPHFSSIKPQKNKPETSTNITPENKTYITDDILNSFRMKPEELPSHVTPTISPRSGQIIGLNLMTSDGNTLRVARNMREVCGTKLIYMAFSETLPNGSKKYLNIDTDSKQFLKTNISGKPIVDEDEGIIYLFTQEEAEEQGVTAQYNKYMNEIFATGTEKRTKVEAPTVKYAPTRKRKPAIDQIRIEDYENKNLNRLLDNKYLNSMD